MPVELGPIEWEECKVTFLEKYFLHVRRKVKIVNFIDPSQSKVEFEKL